MTQNNRPLQIKPGPLPSSSPVPPIDIHFKLHQSVVSKTTSLVLTHCNRESGKPIREYFLPEGSLCEMMRQSGQACAVQGALLPAGWPYTQLVCMERVARIKCHNSNASALTVEHDPHDGQTNFRDAIPIILLSQN